MKYQTYKTTAVIALLMAALVFLTSFIPLSAFAGANVPVTIDIPVTYIVHGNAKIAGGDTVTLKADDPASPMPGGAEAGKKTITIKNEGSYSFGDIRYEEPGVHWYTIIRNVTKKKGVTKDESVYRAKVIALNDGHGYVIVYKKGDDEKSELIYADKVAPDTGDISNILVYFGLAIAAALSLAVFAAVRMRNNRREVQNGIK